MCASVVEAVTGGLQAVVVTDAGMPTISDPGERVVAAVAAAGLPVGVVPGPCAVSAALALSGLPASEYRFVGFLPRKGRERREALDEVRASRATTVVYEAPNRVARTLGDLAEACGAARPVAAAREITKLHEEVWRGNLAGAVDWLAGKDGEPRGEWVLVVAGSGSDPAFEAAEASDEEVMAALREILAAQGADRRSAVAEVAAAMGVAKRRVYDLALGLKGQA
jgi:16S rRNA (cytidine1402-2'-O)-methyltransferase